MAEGKKMITCQLIKVVNCRPVVVGKSEDGQPIVKYEEVHDPKAPLNFVLVPANKNGTEEKPTGKIFLQRSNTNISDANQITTEKSLAESNSKVSAVSSLISKEPDTLPSTVSAVPSMVSKESDTSPSKVTESQADIAPSEKNVKPIISSDLINDKEASSNSPIKDNKPYTILPEPNKASKHIIVKEPYICQVCSKKFVSKCDAEIHRITHVCPPGEKIYTCDVCGKKFTSGSGFTSHKKTHETEKPFLCEVCGKKFLIRGNLLNHLKAHRAEEAHSCSVCEKSCKTGGAVLSAHKRIHFAKGLFYSCETCGKNFRMRGRYQRHVRIHQEEKRHCCSICGLEFVSGAQLKKHLRTHAGEKPYSCRICKKKFSSQEGLRLHTKRHMSKKLHACPKCPETFKSKSNVRMHVQQQHSENKSYSCKRCKRVFAEKKGLKKHKADKACKKTKH